MMKKHKSLWNKQINRCDSNQHISFKANLCSGSCSENLHCKYQCLIMFDEVFFSFAESFFDYQP